MSDSSQGSGWWQGTDGKWYPPVVPMASGPGGGIGVVLLVVSAILWTSSTSVGGYDCGSVVSPASRGGISFGAFLTEIECKDALGSRRSTTIIFALSGVVAFGLAALAGWAARDATRSKLKTDSQNNQ